MGFFARLRDRLWALLSPAEVPALAPAVTVSATPEPAVLTSLATAKLKRVERRLEEAEANVEKAMERARRAEQRAKTAEARTVSAGDRARKALQREMEAETRLTQVEERTRRSVQREKEAEARAKAAEERARSTMPREGPSGARSRRDLDELPRSRPASRREPASRTGEETRLRAAEERGRGAEERLRAAEERARNAEERARALEDRLRGAEERAQRGERSAPVHVAEVAFSPGEGCLEMIRTQIQQARRSMDLCVFTVTDDRLAEAILEAHRRGVRVRLITDNDKSMDAGSDVDRLSRAGVPVRMDRTEFHMHHKFAVFDGRLLLTGSYNWTRSAARYNEENLIATGESRLVEPFVREFESLWRRFGPA
ncbi:phospholipase D-like domain-containing protein [Chondromyces crocatus]|uniref:phospholipase D n=1 Tax=Chondromyces crocatus TaxID=52 RepID=A0A0K1E859_CHOCO|nr:phospholipase D-like domain-containing protein [Chondromyces crocatus]AKT36872.1 uncharacterized protein CMC5_009930 [Chondromyces crocatus]